MTVPRKKTQIGNMKASKAELAANIDNVIFLSFSLSGLDYDPLARF
jgi:hypothetical protein